MNKKEMKKYKDVLLEKKEKIVESLRKLEDDTLNKSQRDQSGDLSGYSLHMADVGTDNFDREFALNLLTNEQGIMYDIDDALTRIENGTFGTCEMCSKDIGEKRLSAVPSARMCKECQEAEEKKKKSARRL
ncbi:MAG TPA: TraR/DksA family transcriptional regulator [bacterium]|nr:TraR/DksA family transcriptional regulator [bacterium]